MNAPSRLALFAVGLLVILGGGFGLGRVVNGSSDAGRRAEEPQHHPESAAAADAADLSLAEELPGGLSVAQGGYRLAAESTVFEAGRGAELRFRVIGPDGRAVQDFDVAHEKELHLIVASRDLTSYQHVHPQRDAGGTWRQTLTLPAAGPYRAIADFVPDRGVRATPPEGPDLALGFDLVATGDYRPAPLPPVAATTTVDGYDVTLTGSPVAPGETEVGVRVTREGSAVALEPYLGAAGHLVALRSGDLAYLHVHPTGGEGGDVRFNVEVPSAGTYRLFFDFSHRGTVRTAGFTVEVADGPAKE